MKPMFSVVIPTFNRADLIEQALQSVFGQRFTSYEVIVVDDGSTDSTVRLLRPLEPRLRIFTQPNRGPGAARNLGAAQAHGPYLAFLDSDDIWFPWTLEIYARILRQTGNPTFLAGRPHRFGTGAPSDAAEEGEAHWVSFADYLASSDQWCWYGVSSFVVSRTHFLKAGGFAPEFRVGEDADLSLRLGTEPGFVQVTAPATFGYREHTGNMSSEPQALLDAALKVTRAELAGVYPGGRRRRRERWRILTRQVRPAAIASLRVGTIGRGFNLYTKTFVWQLATGSWRFLLGFPLLAAFYAVAPHSRKT
jgi:cellulose synthase/poly-beta-1,6-N-acetylglucosamine synthase-like glycosyltransferase